MLGRFLEVSVVVPDAGAAWQRWLALGFAAAEAGDIWPHAYGVAACEGIAVGLHAAGDEPLCLTFVKPDVAGLERELADRLIGIERARIDADSFNLLELREPGGMLLRVLESRTFSPPADLPAGPGAFRRLSLPCADLAEVRGFWERLGIEVTEALDPWDSLNLAGLPLACHAYADCREPMMIFDAAGVVPGPATMQLPRAPELRALRHRRHALTRTPEGITLLELAPSPP